MKNTKISDADLLMEIDECRAIACFLAESISLLLEEHTSFTEKCPVPWGARSCLDSLSDKLQRLSEKI